MRCFFFNDTATTEIYTLSLHDALPISLGVGSAEIGDPDLVDPKASRPGDVGGEFDLEAEIVAPQRKVLQHLADRKSTRLNSSHANLVCRLLLEKKKYWACQVLLLCIPY